MMKKEAAGGQMKFLAHVYRTKGFVHSIERSAQILRRYFFGKARFSDMMSYLDDNYNGSDVKVTFCVTASLLNDHSAFIKKFQALGHEFAAHGYHHTDMKKKSGLEQDEIIRKCLLNFERHNIPVYGFRCPYLSYNSHTMEALSKSRFSWVSNDVIFWEEMGIGKRARAHLKKLSALYSFHSSSQKLSLPGRSNGLVDIPITAPDDEMIFERCRIKDTGRIAAIWLDILLKIYERGELFHLLFHPERFPYVREAIKSAVSSAKGMTPGIWFATLHQIADWTSARCEASWRREEAGGGECNILLKAPVNSTVLIKDEKGGRQDHFYRGYMLAPQAQRINGEFVFRTREPHRGVLHLSKDAPREMEEFLTGEGFFVERTGRPEKDALFIGHGTPFTDRDRLGLLEAIDSSPYPLYRLWRWPNRSRCAFAISSDVDSINIADFLRRLMNF